MSPSDQRDHPRPANRTAIARQLRQRQTFAEKTLWALVRNRRVGGFKFMRQAVIDRYIVDFVCESSKVIVELDGPVHEGREDHDAERTRILELCGYLVLRFRNERVLADPSGTVDEILSVLRMGRA
ncbi:endonuclease domain-containing protein [Caulobacter sp.]|uniref:endonuclease domain-containing protein n=1 Tax=Caulobacter sp. TaxID=78 RepID=UPI002B470D13|nr:endonuclease domain-containing protein [Caulobacter sp.]HJV42208.1 endonuclease domain-containing protein [Caulobacter sp.]